MLSEAAACAQFRPANTPASTLYHGNSQCSLIVLMKGNFYALGCIKLRIIIQNHPMVKVSLSFVEDFTKSVCLGIKPPYLAPQGDKKEIWILREVPKQRLASRIQELF